MMRCVFWIGILLLVFVGASKAGPMDSPDTVYIDGQPCNSFCQSYMAWSRAVSKGMAQEAAPRSAKRRVARVREARPHERVAKHSAPGHRRLHDFPHVVAASLAELIRLSRLQASDCG